MHTLSLTGSNCYLNVLAANTFKVPDTILQFKVTTTVCLIVLIDNMFRLQTKH